MLINNHVRGEEPLKERFGMIMKYKVSSIMTIVLACILLAAVICGTIMLGAAGTATDSLPTDSLPADSLQADISSPDSQPNDGLPEIPLYTEDDETVIGAFGVGELPSENINAADYATPMPQELQPEDFVIVEPYNPPSSAIRSVAIAYSGKEKKDVTIAVGEIVRFTVIADPFDIDINDEIIWSSSDQEIVEASLTGPDGIGVIITGKSSGCATLKVAVSGVEAECIIRVRDIRR